MENLTPFFGGEQPAFDFSKMCQQFAPKEQKEGETKPVHYAVICDKCDHTPIGIRYKCEDCQDFDYCEECFVKDNSNHFNGKHNFTKMEKPEECKFFQQFVEKKQQQEVSPSAPKEEEKKK